MKEKNKSHIKPIRPNKSDKPSYRSNISYLQPRVGTIEEAQKTVAITEQVRELISKLKAHKNIFLSEKSKISFLEIVSPDALKYSGYVSLIKKSDNIGKIFLNDKIRYTNKIKLNNKSRLSEFFYDNIRVRVVSSAASRIDQKDQKEVLLKELDYTLGFLRSVEAKLSNEKFVANAKPDVLARERQKQADAEAKRRALEASLAALG